MFFNFNFQIQIKRKKCETSEEDQLCIVYTLLGETGGDNAVIQWRRKGSFVHPCTNILILGALEQQIPTKNFILKVAGV